MTLTTSDLIVLAVLLRTGPIHGYEVWRQLEASDVRDWARVSRPQIYYSLRKLAASAHLQRTDEAGPSRGPERATFQATPIANEALKEALRADQWTERDPPTPFLTWCALGLLAEPETIRRQLTRRHEKLEVEIRREQETIQALANVAGRDAAVGRALVLMAIDQMKAEMQGLNELSKALLWDEIEDGA